MRNSFCDQVIMSVTEEMLKSPREAFSDIVSHIQSCPSCREAVSRKFAMQRLVGFVEMDPIAARRMTVRVLSSSRKGTQPQSFLWGPFGAYALSATFAVILGMSFYMQPSPSPSSVPPMNTQPAVAAKLSPPLPSTEPAEQIVHHVTLDQAKTLTMRQGAKIWMRPGTRLELLDDTIERVFTRVIQGQIIVSIDKRTSGFEFVVETPNAKVISLGTVFSVEVGTDGRETIRVSKSAVVVRPLGERDPMVVRAGEELVLGGADTQTAEESILERDLCLVQGTCVFEAPEAKIGASSLSHKLSSKIKKRKKVKARDKRNVSDEIDTALWEGRLQDAEHLLNNWKNAWGDGQYRRMLKLAAAYRSARNFKRAVAVYEQLYSLYPDRDAAVNGLVSVAQIKQAFLKDPAGAVHYFDRYIQKRPKGILAEAAAAGKVRALYNMRHWQDVVEASNQYMTFYSGGPSEREILQKRRQAFETLGKLKE